MDAGTQHGESALFYGHPLGEIVRRIDGRCFGTYFREEIAEPFKIDIHIGVDDDIATRIANVEDPGEKWRMQMLEGASDLRRRALENPVGLLVKELLNSTRWRKADSWRERPRQCARARAPAWDLGAWWSHQRCHASRS